MEEPGENDRSSTEFLPPDEFERVADEFFKDPAQSVRDWETAAHAQRRIVDAVSNIVVRTAGARSIAIVSHGAVGTLLYCHLRGVPISREYDQPANGGGNFFSFPLPRGMPNHPWRPIDVPAASQDVFGE